MRIFNIVILIITFFHSQSIAQTNDILDRVKEFVQAQKSILPQYTALSSVTFCMNEDVIEGKGTISFEPPGTWKEEIQEVACYVDGNLELGKEEEQKNSLLNHLLSCHLKSTRYLKKKSINLSI